VCKEIFVPVYDFGGSLRFHIDFIADLNDKLLKAPLMSKNTPRVYSCLSSPLSILSTASLRAVSVPLLVRNACWALVSGFYLHLQDVGNRVTLWTLCPHYVPIMSPLCPITLLPASARCR
jgi:hypothetical protein